MKIKSILDENFQDYKKPSMMIATCVCDWKCLKECNADISICQNSVLSLQKDFYISTNLIVDRYIKNPITKAIIIAGLEPMLQFEEVLEFVKYFRDICNDDIVIYTGYYPDEIPSEILRLKLYENIIIKFGRFVLDSESIYDNVLGVNLSSNNQYAVKIS